MADPKKEKSVNEIIQALDALRHLARKNRRASPRAGSSSSKDGSDDSAVTPRALLFRSTSTKDRAASDEASPRARVIRRRSSSPVQTTLKKPDKIENGEGEEDDSANSAHSEQVKRQGFVAVTPEVNGKDEKVKARVPILVPSPRNGTRRMGCLCSVEVVAAQGLPPSTDGLGLSVTVRKKETRDGAVQTMTSRVQLGATDFDEALYVRYHLDGGGATEPRPFLLSLVVDAPELDMDRSTVDLSLFAKEFTERCRQGERFRQWDMVIPLAGKAEGGELVVKLAFQSIQQDGGSVTRAKTLKVDTSAPDLRGVEDSSRLDDLEPEPSPIEEVKEMQQKEPERPPSEEKQSEADDEHIQVTAVVQEEQEKESEQEQTNDELTLVTKVKEHEKQDEPADDEATPMAEVKDKDQQQEPEQEPTTLVVDGVEEEDGEKQNELIHVVDVEQQKEPEQGPANEPIIVAEVAEEEQEEPRRKPADEPSRASEVKNMQEEDHVIIRDDDAQEVKVELRQEAETKTESEEEEEEAAASLTSSDEVPRAVAWLLEKSIEVTMKPVDAEAAQVQESNEESILHVPEQGDKGAFVKPSKPPLKWRTVALLIPVSILLSKALGAN